MMGLLLLPGEVRNLIYKFVLTSNSGQLFCKEKRSLQPTPNRHSSTHETEPLASSDKRIALYYEHLRPGSLKLYEDEYGIVEANQLQYVCRSLRNETKGLGLKYNNIIFVRREEWEAAACYQFARFLHHCGLYWRSRMRLVTLRSASPDIPPVPEDHEIEDSRTESERAAEKAADDASLVEYLRSPLTSFNQIAKFCTDYLETKVENHLDFVNGETWSSLWQNGLLALAHCRHGISPRLYGTNTDLYYDVIEPGLRVAKEANLLLSGCDNYEIHPHDEPFDEDAFRRGIEQEWDLVQEDLRLVDGGVETWVHEVKSWYRDGL
ncbi:hypothetical protein HBI56_209920 [Parastagonospora nodorum]|nr:hypothetical protein HBH52_233290 [Parastagonospora nodorum]KAH3991638.1 hypothetical protein HBI10_230680 [Parastagonospora nodorum]KAH4009423.1 hypothetical protein HBI13_218340 [Parastagonospora nodorum]KAH4015106.1 hypothetical protein HBI09_206850 [Parastagonospora nodorum]KAH4044314.1 hypothetical protein HBH49_217540 [Parastagonospora nodorum]